MRARILPAPILSMLRLARRIALLCICAALSFGAVVQSATAAFVKPAFSENLSTSAPALHMHGYFRTPPMPSSKLPVGFPAEATGLPDAPQPNITEELNIAAPQASDFVHIAVSAQGAASVPAPIGTAPNRRLTPTELDAACQSGVLRGKPCNLQWLPALWEALEVTMIENMGNITLDSDTRNALTTHDFWGAYAYSVKQYRFGQWSDDTTFIVHDIGHPMQGAGVYSIYDQNNPKTRGMLIENSRRYWIEHLKAMAFVTAYEIQWKLGPASEASIGNSGYNTYYTPRVIGRSTNETGFQDFFITPVYGLGWHITEDLVDRFVMPHIWKRTHNKWILTALVPITPCRDAANILRYKPFYYRDYPLTPMR